MGKRWKKGLKSACSVDHKIDLKSRVASQMAHQDVLQFAAKKVNGTVLEPRPKRSKVFPFHLEVSC